jgi:hypothetical protein
VLSQVKNILENYGINTVTGDQYQADPIGQHLMELGIVFNPIHIQRTHTIQDFSRIKALVGTRKGRIIGRRRFEQTTSQPS